MCIILVKPKGIKMPAKAILRRCAESNPDGFGFATKDRIYKTLSLADFMDELKTIRKEEAAILHFRYATHGSKKAENCHPFKDHESGVSFAHNGILDITPIDDMTDSETAFRTRIVPIIREYGYNSTSFDSENYNIIGWSRFAYIDKEGNYKLYGNFIKYKGCCYSNEGFRPYTRYSHSTRRYYYGTY